LIAAPRPSLQEASAAWTRIAMLSFGGPAAQIAMMHRVIVEEKGWVEEEQFLHALNFCTLLPGPEAQQLATYIGWLLHGVRGGLIAGLLFIAPGVAAIMALSWLYVLYGNLGWVDGLLFGLKAAVLAIVVHAVHRLAHRALKARWQYWLAAAAFLLIAFTVIPFPVVVIGAGLAGWLIGNRPASAVTLAQPLSSQSFAARAAPWLLIWLVPVAALLAVLGPHNVMTQIAVFFSGAAIVTFGGAYTVLAFVAQQAVEHFHWLSAREMLDGLGLAETTPGPLIMVLQFVGFLAAYRNPGLLNPLLAGTIGGLIATFVTFAPCFLWIMAGAPYVERLRGNVRLSGALAGVTSAAVGVIASLALWFGVHTLFGNTVRYSATLFRLDVPQPATVNVAALLLALAAAVAIFRFKVGIVPTILGAAAAGIVLRTIGLT
jgi:chromate transporter